MAGETTMSVQDVLESLRDGQVRLMGVLRQIDESAADVPVGGQGRSAKDWVAILIHHAGDVAGGLGADLSPPPYVVGVGGRLDIDEWHRRAAEYWRPVAFGDQVDELDRIVDKLAAAVRTRTDKDMNATDRIPWAGERPLWAIVGGVTFRRAWPECIAALGEAQK